LPALLGERDAALAALHRPADALADSDEGLRLPQLTDSHRARFLRGRGFALTELNRLDEAEAAYNDSLKIDPNNPIALRELQYIAGLRAGRPRTATELSLPQPH
jgi:tetratricopeptide (TPR) repeat protein